MTRTLRRLAAITVIASVIGGAAVSTAMAQTKTLRIATYGGSWLEAVKANVEPPFKQATGANVEYTVGGPRETLGKLLAAKGQDVPFDVVEWPNDIQQEAIKQGLVERVDKARVPNIANVQREAALQPGYAPAVSWVISGLIYDRAKFRHVGLQAPDSYSSLREAKLAGHVALPDIRNPVAPAFLAGLSQDLTGNEAAIDNALQFLGGAKDPIFYPNFAVLQSRFSSGDIWLVPGNLAYVIRLNAAGLDVGFVRPKVRDKRGVAQANMVDIVKGTKQLELAEAWLNTVIDAKAQTGMAKATGYSPTNLAAAREIGTDSKLAEGFLTDPGDVAALFFPDWDRINSAYPEWIEKWNRAMRR